MRNAIFSLFLLAIAASAEEAVDLGSAGKFAILAKAAVSTTGETSIEGHIGISPSASTFITGFSLVADASNEFSQSFLVTGHIFAASDSPDTPAELTTAVAEMEAAYTDASGRDQNPVVNIHAGGLDGKTLEPGLYTWDNTVHFENALYLKGQGVYILQIAENLEVGNGAEVILQDGATAEDIFWAVAGGAIIGTTAHVEGIILSKTLIEFKTGSTLNGAAYAQTAVTLDSTTITIATANRDETYPEAPDKPTKPNKPSDSDNGCFSGVATVQVLGKGSVPMRQLQVGDHVLTAINGQFESIYSFGHYDPKAIGHFLQLYSESENGVKNKLPLEMTAEHLVFLQGKTNPVRADFVKVGDVLSAGQDGLALTVTKVGSVKRNGLYNPLTTSGTLVVDGIRVSSYIALQDHNEEYMEMISWAKAVMSHQTYVHMTLSPFRLLCQGVSSSFCTAHTEEGIPYYISLGIDVTEWANKQNIFVESLFFAVVIMLCLACMIIEHTFGASLGPLVAFTAAAGFGAGIVKKLSFKKIKSV